ncbi:MAG TPA: S41 family peptidase [Bacilli bacterium]|nr:S41 family peptidase [Bacilli bacterium]
MKKKKQYYFKLKEVIILIVITSIVMVLGTGIVLENKYKNSSSDEVVITDENVKNFLAAYQTLTEKYYEEVDNEDLMSNVITAMFNYFDDPYTTYLNKNETTSLIESLSGEYEGIGAKITKDDRGIVILEVLENSSAMEEGLKKDDVILEVNDENVESKTAYLVSEMIINGSSDKVKLTILRDNEELDFYLTVKTVEIPSIETELISDDTAYLYIDSFSLNTSKQVREKVNNYENAGIKNLIIDVRNDTGGYLSIAEDIAKIFLEKNAIIYSIENKDGLETIRDNTLEASNLNVVVLINGESASASEVLAAALKESYGAILVGETSYGKGKVQRTEMLDDGSMIKYTTAKWLTPTGDCIDGVGLIPDYEVTNGTNTDNQLAKAIELLKE